MVMPPQNSGLHRPPYALLGIPIGGLVAILLSHVDGLTRAYLSAIAAYAATGLLQANPSSGEPRTTVSLSMST